MEVIQAVLATYGVYTASLEREYIKAQQKPAPPIVSPVKAVPLFTTAKEKPNGKTARIRSVMTGGNWWTVTELSDRTGIPVELVFGVLSALKRQGDVETERVFRGQPRERRWLRPQRYRMVTR